MYFPNVPFHEVKANISSEIIRRHRGTWMAERQIKFVFEVSVTGDFLEDDLTY